MKVKVTIRRMDSEIDISQADFEAFEEVRESGRTNMFDVGMVSALSGLTETRIKAIIMNYDKLSDEFKVKE